MGQNIRRMVPIWLLAALLMTSAEAQRTQVSAKAVLSSGLVKLGGEVEMRVEVENASSAKIIEVPKVPGIEILGPSAPQRSSFAHRLNGRVFRQESVSWKLLLRPTAIGEFEVPPLRLEINGTEYLVPKEPLTLTVKKDLDGAELGFLEMVDLPKRVYEGQPFTLDLRLGWAKSIKLGSAGLYLPWWSSLPGTLDVLKPPSSLLGAQLEINVNRKHRVPVDTMPPETRGDHTFEVLSIRRRLIASRPGELQFPQSTFEFSERLKKGRGFEPDQYRDYYANLDGFVLEVLPIPEDGRPFEWTGAVGALNASRRLEIRDVDAGDSIRFEVAWTGDANVEFFDAPDLSRIDAFQGFRVLGVNEVHDATSRRATYDLVPLSHEVREVPPVPLWTFDPGKERFTKVETEPVPIRVRPVAGLDLPPLGGPDEEVFDIRDLHVVPSTGGSASAPSGWVIFLILGGVLAGWGLLRRVARRSGDPAAPANRRRRRASGRLRRELRSARTAEDQASALSSFLGARTDEASGAWIGRDGMAWADEQGLTGITALDELRELQAELDSRTWGAGNEPVESRRVEDLARKLMQEGL